MSRFSYYPPILAYHRIGALRGDHVPTISAEAFERQLRFLARFRYQVISLQDLVDRISNGRVIPRHCAVITFDDGYEETVQVASPLLRRFGFPAAVFVTPSEVGRPGFVTWQQVAAMAKDGFAVGNHTMNHSYLPLVEPGRLAEELVDSKRLIEERIGRPVTLFSYPVGGYTTHVQSLLKEAGYVGACTTNRAASVNGIDPFALRRIKITERDGHPLIFWAKVSGYYDLFHRLEQPN